MGDYSDLETIYYAYRDARDYIEQADAKIKELEDRFGNKDVIKSIYKHNELLRKIAHNLAHFFEEMEEEGEGQYQEIIPIKDIEEHLKGVVLWG
ncbi:hypothetical protein DSCW_60260 [Desulfosarcina widdelii]|uniref:Uncharacterized protein n=1 Tax=Desulfosarcina widdelii TaxID=947919 RepID=A0A5K7ZEM2_9BACT|nr:hypothetical protein [Desulfosarcina widdelii]BBO78609.1 hypothetical protein DSCW_60260 [Desulfosarcina widdelii]